MKSNTKTSNTIQETTDAIVLPASDMSKDLKTAVLIVSVFVNLVVLVAWIALQVTSRYDGQLASFIFGS